MKKIPSSCLTSLEQIFFLSFPYFSTAVYASQFEKSKRAKSHLHLSLALQIEMLYHLVTLEIRNQVS